MQYGDLTGRIFEINDSPVEVKQIRIKLQSVLCDKRVDKTRSEQVLSLVRQQRYTVIYFVFIELSCLGDSNSGECRYVSTTLD